MNNNRNKIIKRPIPDATDTKKIEESIKEKKGRRAERRKERRVHDYDHSIWKDNKRAD
ncbi:MAG: hypothetical protein ACE5J7_03040 [Candidatus Aenigmatarchaeota archaeon]